MVSTQTILEIVTASSDVPHAPICLMGVNGSGKTRLLNELHQNLRVAGFATMMIGANRQTAIPVHTDPIFDSDDFSNVLDRVVRTAGAAPSLTTMIGNLISRFINKGRTGHNQFINAVAHWIENGKVDPEPQPPTPAFANFQSALSEIVGYEIQIDPPRMSRPDNSASISIKIGNEVHSIDVLSSGEKQLLMFSILLLQKSEERVVLLVDEPELHLNEALAIDMWERIEKNLPRTSFIYATHSLGFATRPTTGHLFIIEKGREAYPVPSTTALSNRVVRDLVGARISVRDKGGVPIFCEDDGHRLLIGDLFERVDFEPIPLGGRSRVISALKANSAFQTIFPGHNARCGVLDRDFMLDDRIKAYEQQGIFSLPYNDFEACLLHPSIMTKHLFTKTGQPLKEDDYRSALTKAAKTSLNETLNKLARQIEDDFSPKLTFRINGDQVEDITAQVAGNTVGAFQQRADALLSCIRSADVEGILQLVKGKKLYQHFRNTADSHVDLPKEPSQLYYNLRQQSEFLATLRAIPALVAFKNQIEAYIASYEG